MAMRRQSCPAWTARRTTSLDTDHPRAHGWVTMRLTEEKITALARQLTKTLAEHPGVTLNAAEPQIEGRIRSVITEDLKREEALDDEVKRLIEPHIRGKNRMTFDYEALFKRAKAQLVKDKGLVI